MKVNNIVLLFMLFMLSDVSFSKNLVATKVRPKVRDVSFVKPDPNVKYYIYEFFNVLIADFKNPRRAASTLYTYDHKNLENLQWVFENNFDGSLSLRNVGTNNYLTSKRNGEYELNPRNEYDVLQKFVYKDKSLKSIANDNCVEMKRKSDKPNPASCPHPLTFGVESNTPGDGKNLPPQFYIIR